MNQLPSFEPIEQLFPQWLTARTIVEHTLPRALRFEMTSKDTLGVSLDWAQAIIDLAPLEDAQAVRERLNAAWGHASAVIDMQPLSVLYRKPANQESLHRADSILESQAQEMLAAGKPTPLQILSHFMGITPAYGRIAISFGPDAITEQVRKDFEAWFLSVDHKPYGWLDHNGLERTASGEYYTDGYVQGCWIGYQAGREALERVNAKWREQVEGLRKNAERYKYWKRCWAHEEGASLPLSVVAEIEADWDLEVDEAFDEAMSKREQS